MSRSYSFINTAGSNTGFSVSSAGDVDGDTFDDLIIGAFAANGGAGETYLVLSADLAVADAADGTADGSVDLSLVAGTGGSYRFTGAAASDYAGFSVSSAGDVDGDGLDDLIIGAPTYDVNVGAPGSSYLVLSKDLVAADLADGTDGVIDLGLVGGIGGSYEFTAGAGPENGIGISVSSAGDVDGDNLDDLLIWAEDDGSDGDTSSAYLVLGKDLAALDVADGTLDGTIELGFVGGVGGSYQFVGGTVGDALGHVASAGDVDGDGQDDLLIARGATAGVNTSYLVLSADLVTIDGADGLADGVIDLDLVAGSGVGSYEFIGTVTNTFSSTTLSSAGDVDGDGIPDLIIGVVGDYAADGATYLVLAADLANIDLADGFADGVIDLDLVGGTGGSYQFTGGSGGSFIYSVSSAGDVDGDGLGDLIIGGGNGYLTAGALSSYLVLSADLAAADLADGTVDGVIDLGLVGGTGGSYEFTGGTGVGFVGNVVSSAGDVDGDGLDDLIIGVLDGAPGQTYLILGKDLAAADDDGTGEDGVISFADITYNNIVEGTAGADLIDIDYLGDPGLDRVDNADNAAGTDDDVIQAGGGDDTVMASTGSDSIDGGDGNDSLFGGSDNDTLLGGTGDDSLDGGTGTDTLTGGDGNDRFIWDGASNDTITDFGFGSTNVNNGVSTDNDFVDLSGVFNSGTLAAYNAANGTTFTNPLQALNNDVLDGVINFNGTNMSGPTLTLTGITGGLNEEQTAVLCFASGTLIKTIDGEIAVEDLEVGDRVLTLDAGYQPIQWIGGRKLDAIDLAVNPKLKPIRIRAGALGFGLPEADLVVSPQHRVLVRSAIAERMFGEREVLIPANKLLTLDGIDIEWDAQSVEYFHMLFEDHQIVFSNGAPTESLFTGPEALKAVSDEAREEIMALFPEIASPDFVPVPVRFIPEKGKQMKVLAQRLAKNAKHIVEQTL